MTRSVTAGEVIEREYSVKDSWSTPVPGDHDNDLRILSTPSLVLAVELTCKALIEQYIEGDEQSVGIAVHLRHLAPTPVGDSFKVKARLSSVGGDSYEFEVEASDRLEKIAEGQHTRFMVNLDRFRKRIQSKIASTQGSPE